MNFEYPILIADIGGTNARFVFIQGADAQPSSDTKIKVVDHPSFEAAVKYTIDANSYEMPKTFIFALACPIAGDEFALTNADWVLKPNQFLAETGSKHLYVMNDFVAQGLGAISTSRNDLKTINPVGVEPNGTKIVIGPGTGLGVAILPASLDGIWRMLPGEGGHMDLGPRTKREMELWPFLRKQNGRMEAELAVSGQGLENLHQAIVKCDKIEEQFSSPLSASQITDVDMIEKYPSCGEALDMMISCLARIASDLSILTIPYGGVFLAGGITKHIEQHLLNGEFYTQFCDKAPFSELMKKFPINIMLDEKPALSGMKYMVTNSARFELDNCIEHYQLSKT